MLSCNVEKKHGREGFLAVKIDISKAYDIIKWGFLRNMMVRLGFTKKWVDLILKVVSTLTYTFSHESYEFGSFMPIHGLREGDPISPYLFIICAQGLSAMLSKYESRGDLHGIKVAPSYLKISHLLLLITIYFL